MTHTPPTEQQLDEYEALARAATDGPWGAYTFGGDSLIEIAADLEDTGTGYRARRTICRFDEEPMDNDPAHRDWSGEEDWEQVQADAAFVAAMSPGTVKALLAEVRRQRKQVQFLIGAMARKGARTGEGDRALAEFLGSEPAAPSHRLEDGSTHTVQALTDAGEECVQQRCVAARQEAQLRQEAYTLRAAVEAVLDEVRDMADDEQLSGEAAGVLRERLRYALGLDGPAVVSSVETGE